MDLGGEVRNNEARSRFELLVDDALAVAIYKREGDLIRFTHTVVPREMEGRGIGSRLIRAALDEARRNGLRVEPVCPFVRAFIERHAEYQDLLAA